MPVANRCDRTNNDVESRS